MNAPTQTQPREAVRRQGLKALPWILRGRLAAIETKRSARRRLALLVAATALLGLGASAAPALAATHFIHLRTLAQPPVGQPLAITVDGVVAPPAEYWDQSWIEVVSLPGSFGACPSDAQSAGAMAEQAGLILAIALYPHADGAGNFSNAVAFIPPTVGPIFLCGYLYNEVGYTWAAAGMRLDVIGATVPPAGNPGAAGRPVNLTRPWVTRAGRRLVCHPGTWSNANGSYAFNWLFDGHLTRITGRRPIAPGPIGRGHRVGCRVTAYGLNGSAVATSPTLRLR